MSALQRRSAAESESGFVMFAVLIALVVVASIGMLLTTESAMEADRSGRESEARQAEYLAQAALQHALWQNENLACAGDFSLPTAPLGAHSYIATATGGGSTTAYTLSVDQDAWIRSDDVDRNNSSGTQHIRYETGDTEQALYRFDLASLPAGAQINSASAWFFLRSGQSHPEGPLTAYRITSDWTETGATWATMSGKFDSAALGMVAPQSAGGVWVQINLTAQVQAWVNGEPNYGILLTSRSEGTHTQYESREAAASEQPRLEVVVGAAPVSPITIDAIGTLDTGITRALGRTVSAYQAPGSAFLGPVGDVYLKQDAANQNFGASNDLWVEDPGAGGQADTSLLRFNMGLIPRGAKVTSATLELYANWDLSTAPGKSVGVHRVTRDWVEGTNDGASGTGASWNESEPGISWSSPGGDYDATPVATANTPTSTTGWHEWDVTRLVNGWATGAFPNQGLILVAENASTLVGFRGSDYFDESRRPKLTISYTCACGAACMAPQGQGDLLMVVVNPTTLVPTDAAKKALFESWGYTVNVLSESANATAYADAAAVNDAVFISESVNASQVGSKLAGLSIGVVSQDGDYNSDLGIASGSSWPVGDEINVVDSSHYITATFPAGPLEIYDAAMEGLTTSGTVAPGAQQLASWSSAGALVVLDRGEIASGGGNAAGRRVVLPLGRDNNFNLTHLNSNGRLILQRAIAWAMNADAGSSGNLLMVVGNAGSPSSGDLDRQSLMESWGYAVTLIDDGDSQASFDAALAVNDVAFVTEGSDPGAIGSKLTGTTVGIVNEERTLLVELGFTGETDSNSRSEIVILDNTHSITSGLALGTTTITTSNQPLSFTNSGTASGAQILAETNQVSSFFEPSLLTLETNAELWGGGFAAGRRVALPWGDVGFDINALNNDGRTILQRALEWAGTNAGLSGTFLDQFNAVAYDGNDGTLDWSGLWQETGETDGPGGGDFSVVNSSWCAAGNCLQIREDRAASRQLAREADLAGAASASLSLSYRRRLVGTPTGGAITLEISSDGGANFTPLKVYQMDTQDAGPLVDTFDITPYIAANTQIRFSTSNDLFETAMYVDDVLIDTTAGTGESGNAVLMVVGNASTLTTTDDGRLQEMTAWGHTVTVFDDSESQSAFDTAVAANDVIFVTGSVSGGTLADKLTGAPKGIVNEFYGKLDNFGFSSQTGTALAGVDTFTATHPAHEITAPFGGSAVIFATTGLNMPVPGGTLAPDLMRVGDVSGTGALVTLEAGAMRWDGSPAAARRVHLPFADAATTQMTADGIDIMQRAIAWAAGSGGGGGGGGGGGQVVFEEFTEGRNQTGISAGLSIPKPGGTAPGDLLVVAVATDGNTVSTLAPAASWNLSEFGLGVGHDGSGSVTLGVWWKIADGTEGSSLVYSWSEGEQAYGWIMRFTGHDPSSPFATSAQTTGNSRNPGSTNVITSTANNLILRLGAFDDDDITVDAPGLAGHTVITMDRSNTGVQNTVSGGAGYLVQPTAGDTGTSEFNLSGREQYRTMTIAIRPGPPAD